jgi:hypothetical protein
MDASDAVPAPAVSAESLPNNLLAHSPSLLHGVLVLVDAYLRLRERLVARIGPLKPV